jgi:hypothetical protein
MDPGIPDRVIKLAWRSGRTLSPAAERFCLITREIAADLARRYPALAPAR